MRDEVRMKAGSYSVIHPSSLRPHPFLSSPDVYVPQVVAAKMTTEALAPRVKLRARIAWAATLGGALFLLALIVAAPFAAHDGQGFLAQVLYQSFHLVCHQIPERSFYFGAHPFAVCTRCFGLYFGMACGVLLYPLVMGELEARSVPPRSLIIVVALPMALDWTLDAAGLWMNTAWSRFATGVILGTAAAFYVVPGLIDLGLRSLPSSSSGELDNPQRLL